MSELLSCPWCGEPPQHTQTRVWCENEDCGTVCAPMTYERWNNRAATAVDWPLEPTMGMWDDFCSVHHVPFEEFRKAYRAMAGELPTAADWISVTERLPDTDRNVLCYSTCNEEYFTDYVRAADEGLDEHASHWTELPPRPAVALPAEKEKGR